MQATVHFPDNVREDRDGAERSFDCFLENREQIAVPSLDAESPF
jgi:hypothetical protein